MTARSTITRYVLAQATVRAGLMHITSERDTGTYFAVCGAGQIRSREITTWTTAPADVAAVLCEGCAVLAGNIGGNITAGVEVYLGTGPATPGAPVLSEISVDRITIPAGHPRDDMDTDMESLAQSVRAHGILQPLVVRPTADGHELVIGARRLAAARTAGFPTVPAIVRDVSDVQATLDALVENLHRTDLNPIEQARAYSHALSLLACSNAELGRRLGVSREQVSNTLRLLALPEHLQDQVAVGVLSAAHGRALLRVTDPAAQEALAVQIVEESLTTRVADAAARTAQNPRNTREHGDRLDDVARLLTSLLDARVRVTTTAERAHIAIDVDVDDLPRMLRQLGLQAVAA